MDRSTSVFPVSGGNSCEFYVNSYGCGKPYLENKQYAGGDTKEAVIVKSETPDVSTMSGNGTIPSNGVDAGGSFHVSESLEQISISNSRCDQNDADLYEIKQYAGGDAKEDVIDKSKALDKSAISDSDAVPNNGVDADGTFHVSESFEQISIPNSSCDQNDADLYQGFRQSLFSESKGQRSFIKSATFPSSRETCSVSQVAYAKDKCPTSESSAYARSISLPTSLKLVSAMKGGRARNGTPPTLDMRVKWAPEVYDPPCTSTSHTVNSHRQRPKPKKKDSRKNKHKGKPARGSGGSESKKTSNKNITKLPGVSDNGSHASGHKILLNGCNKSGFGVQSSSFLREVAS